MPHAGRMIMNMTSSIGEMFVDKTVLPYGVTQQNIVDFFGDVIIEYNTSYQMKNSDLNQMNIDIDSYLDHCTKEKNKLIAEEASEAAAEIIAGAAMVASACLSWMPGVNFALSAAALAAEATALALEIEAEKLKGTLVEDITSADLHLREYHSFSNVKTYVDKQTKNTLFYPRLQITMTDTRMRAAFLASVVVSKKELKREITSADLKQQYINWYNASKADPTLVDKFSKFYDELKANPEDFTAFNKKFNTFVKEYVPLQYRQTCVSTLLSLTGTLCIRKGIGYYRCWKNANALAKNINSDIGDLDENGNIAEEAAAADTGEMEMLTATTACTMAISFLAGVATFTFGVMAAVEAKNTDKVMTKAISDSRTAIKRYYYKLVHHSL